MDNNKKNLVVSMISMLLSVLQSLWAVSFFSRNIGETAYGYIAVVSSIVNMSTIISLSLTSMSSRYITIELQKKKDDEANFYFNSIYAALAVVSSVFFIIALIIVANITTIINIESNYVASIKVLFILTVGSLICSVMSTPFLASLYYKNKIYIYYFFVAINYCFRILVPNITKLFGELHIYDMALGAFIADMISMVIYMLIYKRNAESLCIKRSYIKLKYVIEVFKSGVWTAISKAGSVLLATITTYMANILLGVIVAGKYSVLVQIESLLAVLVSTLVSVFVPYMYTLYGSNEFFELKEYICKIRDFICIVIGFVCGGMLVFGNEFLLIWTGNDFTDYKKVLFIMIVFVPYTFTTESISQLLITYNKIKINAYANLIGGFFNIIFIILLVKVFDYGVFGLVIGKSIIMLVTHTIIIPMYACRVTDFETRKIYGAYKYGMVIELLTVVGGIIIKNIITISGIVGFALRIVVTTLVILPFIALFIMKKKRKSNEKNHYSCRSCK